MYLHFIMKKLEINMKLHPTTDSETHGNGDSPDQQMLPCYICGKLYHSGEARMLHVKMCARINNVSTSDLLLLIKKSNNLSEKEKKELQNNRQLLAECDNLFMKQPHAKGGSSTKKRKLTYYDPVSVMEEEELQMALAISASLESSCQEMVESSSLHNKDSEKGLLLPAAMASVELVESRTEVLLCTKESHVDLDCDRLSNDQLDTSVTSDLVAIKDNSEFADEKYSKEDHQNNDTVTKKSMLWNVASYAENEPNKMFYALPSLQTNSQTQD